MILDTELSLQVLTEQVYRYNPEFDKAVAVINQIRATYVGAGMRADMQQIEHDPLVEKLAHILGEVFNADIDMKVVAPKSIVAPVKSVAGILGLSSGADNTSQLIDITDALAPNAFTFAASSAAVAPGMSIPRTVETGNGIRFANRESLYVRFYATLFLHEKMSSRAVLAIVLHEIGHNFFLREDDIILRQVVGFVARVASLGEQLRRFNEALMPLVKRDGGGTSVALPQTIISVVDKLIGLIATVAPGTVPHMLSAVEAAYNLVERAVRLVLPQSFLDAVDKFNTSETGTGVTMMIYKVLGLWSWVGLFSSVFAAPAMAARTITAVLLHPVAKAIEIEIMSTRKDEVFADDFATNHGFGPDLADAAAVFAELKKAQRRLSPTTLLYFADAFATAVDEISDPHPSNLWRIRNSLEVLETQYAAGMYHRSDKARLEDAIKRLKVKYSQVCAQLRGTPEEPMVEFVDQLVRMSSTGQRGFSVDKLMSAFGRGFSKGGALRESGPVVQLSPTTLREVTEIGAAIADAQLHMSLNEGAVEMLKNLATGNLEKKIDVLEAEVKDVHTPEQQRLVITKIVALMEELIALRHNASAVKEAIHNSIAWFQRVISTDPGKELTVRTSEAIQRLAKIRDTLLAKKWTNDEDTAKLEELKADVKAKLDKAAQASVGKE